MTFSIKCAFAIVAIVFVQGLTASNIRRSTDETTPFQDLMNNARAQMQATTEEWAKWMQAPSVNEMRSVIENKTKELEIRAKNVMDELKKQVETHGAELSEKASAVIAEATNHINASIENLKAQAPGMLDEASSMQQRFNDAIKASVETMMVESEKIAKAAGEDAGNVHNELANLSRNALSQAMEVMKELQTQAETAIRSATAS